MMVQPKEEPQGEDRQEEVPGVVAAESRQPRPHFGKYHDLRDETSEEDDPCMVEESEDAARLHFVDHIAQLAAI